MKIKIIISLFMLLLVFSCKTEQKKEKNAEAIEVIKEMQKGFKPLDLKVACERTVKLNETKFCLPLIDGMKETYTLSNVKVSIDKLLPKGSIALGYYLNNKTYENVNKLNEIEYDDYLLVFSTELLIKDEISRKTYIDLSNFEEVYKFDWKNQKDKIEKLLKTVTVGKPAIFEKYNLSENVTTIITLNKYITNNSEVVKITIGNTFYLKNKMFITSYNYDYNGISSIRKAKEKNDYMAIRFLNENE